jgi:hypothetical protein
MPTPYTLSRYPSLTSIPPVTGATVHLGGHAKNPDGTVRWTTACGIDYTNADTKVGHRLTCRDCKAR